MFSKSWINVVFALCLCVLVSAGCKGTKPVVEDDTLEPNTFTEGQVGDLPQAPRDEGGTPLSEVKLENVYFTYDSFQVTESELPKIDKVAEIMRARPDVKLTTEGNCDERGSAEYNMSLGEHRALAVRAALVGSGVDASRIQTKTYGKEKPVDPRHCEDAWRQNRRVEFALYAEQAQ